MYADFRRCSFTLAEVLLTLLIIGVVAALTIPSIVSKYKKYELKTRYKEASAIIYNGQSQMIADLTDPANVIFNNRAALNQYFRYSARKLPIRSVYDIKLPYKTLNGNTASVYAMDDGVFELNNGMTVWVNTGGLYVGLVVDTNGYDNPPNKFGYDVFYWGTIPQPAANSEFSGYFKPIGTPKFYMDNKAVYCSYTSTDVNNGLGCTFYAMTDPDYFKNLK